MMLVLSGPISHSIESCDVVSTAFLTSAEEGDLVGQTDSLHISHGPGDSLTEQVAFAAADMAADVLVALDGKYADKRPGKVHAAFVLALNGGHRLRVTVKSLRPYLTAHEYDLSRKWVDEESAHYDALMDRRVAIMHCDRRELIPDLLEYNDIAIQLLSKKINSEIVTKIHAQRAATRKAERRNERKRGF